MAPWFSPPSSGVRVCVCAFVEAMEFSSSAGWGVGCSTPPAATGGCEAEDWRRSPVGVGISVRTHGYMGGDGWLVTTTALTIRSG